MRPTHLKTVLDREFSSTGSGHHTPVMIWGPPGVGKSQLIAQTAQEHHAPLIDIRLSQLEPSDLRGIPFRHEDLVEWAVPRMLPDAERHGPSGILFLDELTSATPAVSAAAYQLILDRSLGDYRVPNQWVIFAAGNRQGDRGVTYSMPSPLANRFTHYNFDVNVDDWVLWAHSNNIDDRVIAFLRFRPELLFDFDPALDPVAFPTPRSWEFAHHALQKFEPGSLILTNALQACVGNAAGVELNAFIDNLHNLPDIDAILNGYDISVPDSIDLQYALASSLVGQSVALAKAKSPECDNKLGNVLNFASRFPQRELGVMLVADMHRAVGNQLFALPQFKEWAAQIAEVMLYDEPQ
ncbi:MAG: MoxR family ATPase [Gammaproteobacteria bacterium]|nr:MoxR family ATPase [Gammaproteobacteria bacterium]